MMGKGSDLPLGEELHPRSSAFLGLSAKGMSCEVLREAKTQEGDRDTDRQDRETAYHCKSIAVTLPGG